QGQDMKRQNLDLSFNRSSFNQNPYHQSLKSSMGNNSTKSINNNNNNNNNNNSNSNSNSTIKLICYPNTEGGSSIKIDGASIAVSGTTNRSFGTDVSGATAL